MKNGIKTTQKQNFLCKDCSKQFQFDYTYEGANPTVQQQIKRSLIHGHGIRDCHTVFKVAHQTVLNLIERFGSTCQIPIAKKHYRRVIIDEFYTFVGHKGKKVWLFYAYAPETKEILTFTMGKRNIQQVRYLMLKTKHLRIRIDTYCTYVFEGFKKVSP